MVSIRKAFHFALIAIATVILLDFLWPVEETKTEILKIHRTYQSHNNASRNSHTSIELETTEGRFSCSDEFIEDLQLGDEVLIKTSPFFNQVGRIKLKRTSQSEIHSLRWFTGFTIPILFLIPGISLLLRKREIGTLMFVLTVALIADLIFLLLF